MPYMPKIYAYLIRKGEKTIDQVPGNIREEVQQLLVDADDQRIQDID